MKIVYILEVNPYTQSGILKKINAQVKEWKKRDNRVACFVIWPMEPKGKVLFEDTKIHKTLANILPNSFIKTYFTKILSQNWLRKELIQFNPDIVYTRQNIWYPGLTKTLANYKTVLEVNTIDYMELQFSSPFKSAVYKYGKSKILNASSGLIAISPNILNHYRDYKKPKMTISNGIDFQSVNTIDKKKEGQTNLIFVGSKNRPWYGLEKVFKLAENLPHYCFNLVGYDKAFFKNKTIPNNVVFHGWLDSTDLKSLYYKCHLGIGSFGNHLIGKDTDSTLKVQEYLAYGLPVLLGHNDVDMLQKDFVLRVTDEEHNFIATKSIVSFIEKNKHRIVTKEEIEEINSSRKEHIRLAFFEKVMAHG